MQQADKSPLQHTLMGIILGSFAFVFLWYAGTILLKLLTSG